MVTQAIVKMGNIRLTIPSTPVTDFNPALPSCPKLAELIANMKDTMEAREGVGITAPQIGCNKRIIMLGFEKSRRYPYEKPVPFTLLINPTYKPLDEEIEEHWEGCLSLPCLRGLVPRYKRIEYSGYDLNGTYITGIAENFHARIIQHECDHLDGILFLSRLTDINAFGYEDELGARMHSS